MDLEEINDYIKNNISIENHRLWKDIDYLIELTNTNIENGEPGYTNIKKSLENEINVITGNKGPILLHYHELKK